MATEDDPSKFADVAPGGERTMKAGLVYPGSFQFVDVDGVRLRVRIPGGGQPLLLIMGLGGSIEM
jgi:hypothetical protein